MTLVYPHHRALIDRLEIAHPNIAVGNHQAPLSDDKETFAAPAAVLYLRPGGTVNGSLGEPDADADIPFQVTGIGRSAKQALWVLDRCHEALTGTPLEAEDRAIARVRRVTAGVAPSRDDDVTPALFHVAAEYRLWSFAAEPIGS